MKSGLRFRVAVNVGVALLAMLSFVRLSAQSANTSSAGRGQFGPPPGGRGGFGPPPGGGLALERLDRELAFTDAQRSQIQTLLASQQTALKSALDQIRQAQYQLDAASMQVPEDDGLIQSQAAVIAPLEASVAVARAQTEAKIYRLLTADQQQKALQWLAQSQQRPQ